MSDMLPSESRPTAEHDETASGSSTLAQEVEAEVVNISQGGADVVKADKVHIEMGGVNTVYAYQCSYPAPPLARSKWDGGDNAGRTRSRARGDRGGGGDRTDVDRRRPAGPPEINL